MLMLLLAATVPGDAFAAGSAATCGGPCFRAARSEQQECRGSADGAFVLERARCLERDPVCVGACLETQEECRDATGHPDQIAHCDAQLESALARCVTSHPTAPKKRARCVDRAQLDGYECRAGARRASRDALAECDRTGDACRQDCGPGTPPAGAAACKGAARLARRAALQSCRRTFQITASACLDKDATCAQACGATRRACEAPIEATLGAAVGACVQAKDAAVAACRATEPPGSPQRESCEQEAGATAFTCRLAARDAAAPGLTACGDAYVACVKACPAS
ncbi:MAG: hypothetical protein KIT14_21680 [bacterium]|nr:hypothetical protein [bacterium]